MVCVVGGGEEWITGDYSCTESPCDLQLSDQSQSLSTQLSLSLRPYKSSENHSILLQWVCEMKFWNFFQEEVQFMLAPTVLQVQSPVIAKLDNSTVQQWSLIPGWG